MKKRIKIILKKLIKIIAVFVPKRNDIVFESIPDLSDNTYSVFSEMIARNLNEKYRFVWLVSDKEKNFPAYPNTIYLDMSSFKDKIKFVWYAMRAKCLISCNRFLSSYSKKTKSFFLTHGSGIKSTRSYYTVPGDIDYVIIASEGTKQVMSYELNYDIERCIPLGFPRNDILLTANLNLNDVFEGEFSKIIVWYPTFKQHKNGSKLTNSSHAFPIIHEKELAEQLNEWAKLYNILIVIKPHFAQDVRFIVNSNLSNIKIIDDHFFIEKGITSYEFVGSCDSLITDYSSIYYDYLLCDKPIALVWEDFEEYKQKPGFAIDPDVYLAPTHKIYTIEDFEPYLYKIANDIDEYKSGRAEINKWANYSGKPDNSKRVVDFIVEKAML